MPQIIWLYLRITNHFLVVLVSNKNIYIDIKPDFPSVSIDIEISGHEMFPRDTFQIFSQVLVGSQNVNKYGVSVLVVSES